MPDTPFKLLDAYEKNDIGHFFGRGRETARLYNALSASNLVLLYGASGTGKTSLVRCGLSNKYLDSDWKPVFIRWKGNISDSITRELIQITEDPNLKGALRFCPLTEQIDRLANHFFRTIYLIFDQFEELFVLGSMQERQEFYQSIAAILKAKLPVKVLITIREEYLAYLSEFEKVVPALFDNRLRIEKMNDLNLYRVVAGTARFAGVTVSEAKETIPAIVNNIRNPREGVELAHLQIYMARLYRQDQRRNPDRTDGLIQFDPELVGKTGQLDNIIADFVEEQVKVLNQELRQRGNTVDNLAMEILYTLVTDDSTKRIRNATEIVEEITRKLSVDRTLIEFCITRFNELKLIRILPDE